MAVLIPHFDLPFRFGAYTEQGGPRDLANCVFAIVSTPAGFRDEVPNFGIPDLAFGDVPVMDERIQTRIKDQEPRATLAFSEQAGLNQLERLIRIKVDA